MQQGVILLKKAQIRKMLCIMVVRNGSRILERTTSVALKWVYLTQLAVFKIQKFICSAIYGTHVMICMKIWLNNLLYTSCRTVISPLRKMHFPSWAVYLHPSLWKKYFFVFYCKSSVTCSIISGALLWFRPALKSFYKHMFPTSLCHMLCILNLSLSVGDLYKHTTMLSSGCLQITVVLPEGDFQRKFYILMTFNM